MGFGWVLFLVFVCVCVLSFGLGFFGFFGCLGFFCCGVLGFFFFPFKRGFAHCLSTERLEIVIDL